MAKLQGLRAGNTSKSCSYCSLHHWHFPDAKVPYDLSKTRKEQRLSCVCNMSLDTWLCKNKDSVPGLLSQLTLDPGTDSLGCSNPTGEWHLFNLLETESPLTLSDERPSILCAPGWIPPSCLYITLIRGSILETQGIKNELEVLSLPTTYIVLNFQ